MKFNLLSFDKALTGETPFMNHLADSFEGLDLFAGIENFTNPVFIIHGEADQSVPIEYGRKYASIYKNASFHQVNGASHCFTDVLHRKEFNEQIIKFLTK